MYLYKKQFSFLLQFTAIVLAIAFHTVSCQCKNPKHGHNPKPTRGKPKLEPTKPVPPHCEQKNKKKEEFEKCRKAAEEGDIKAQFELGKMYMNGYGIAQDDKQAVAWYQEAAGKGNAQAKTNLGGCIIMAVFLIMIVKKQMIKKHLNCFKKRQIKVVTLRKTTLA